MRHAIEYKFCILYVENGCIFYTNYAMVVLPSRTLDNKILHTRYYKVEIGVTILKLVKRACVN